jgi:DNA polymerase III delta prime subunit
MHHAYAIAGERKRARVEILDFLKKELKFPIIGNPDLWQGEFNVLKISDSRSLSEAHQNKPVKYGRKIFLIQTNFITRDAQNSLLKILEEPQAEAIFFITLPGTSGLIPTLKSRLIFGRVEGGADTPDQSYDPAVFLASKAGKRLTMVAKILKDLKDEKISKADVITFLKALEREVKGRGDLLSIEDLEKAISYAGDESPSLKVILEHLAVVL